MFFPTHKKKISAILKKLAKNYNLSYKRGRFFEYPEVKGFVNAGQIKISQSPDNLSALLMTIEKDLKLKNNLLISEETSILKIKKALGSTDIITGDTSFDNDFIIESEEPYIAHAFLTEKVRNILKSIHENTNFELSDMELSFYISVEKIITIQNFKYLIDTADDIYRELANDINRPSILRCKKRMINNMLHDSDEDVRLKNIIAAGKHLKIDTDIRDALISIVNNDMSFLNRFHGALILGNDGLTYMQNLLKEPIENSLKIEILKVFSEKKYSESRELLKKICIQEDLPVQKEIINTIIAFNNFSDLPFLTRYLHIMEEEDSLTFIHRIAEEGDLSAVEYLYKISKEGKSNSIKNQAHYAIAKIQSRFDTGDRGWVSLNESDENRGKLSIENIKEGNLSITKKSE